MSEEGEILKNFYISVIDSMPIGAMAINTELVIASMNPAMESIFNLRTEDYLGMRVEELFCEFFELQCAKELTEKLRTVLTSEDSLNIEVRFNKEDKYIDLTVSPLTNSQDTVIGLVLTFEDITERKQTEKEKAKAIAELAAERERTAAIEAMVDALILRDMNGKIVFVNSAFEEMADYKKSSVTGKNIRELAQEIVKPEEIETVLESIEKTQKGERMPLLSFTVVTKSGQEIPVTATASFIKDVKGKPNLIVTTIKDISELKKMEEKLVQSAKMASLGNMAEGIAKELRNPLGIISSISQFLLEHTGDIQLYEESIKRIYNEVRHASLIIEQLLKFAIPDGEKMRKINLHFVLEDVLAILSTRMNLQEVILKREFQPNLPEIYGNSELLRQVFTNLVLNACKAMPQGGKLTVKTQNTKSGEVKIQFIDTGHGVYSEHLPKIFDPFFTTMSEGKGIGLGLSISYSIVQKHGGTIEVDTKKKKGANFTVILPVKSEE